jgi:hypothetical protein
MGNIIVKDANDKTSPDLNLKTDTDLGLFIHNWALNDYKIHPNANFNNSLKKRACCTYNNKIGIGISGIDSIIKQPVNSTKNKSINQYKVLISPLGLDQNPDGTNKIPNIDICKIDQNQYFDDITTNSTNRVNSTKACFDFYRDSKKYILMNRSNNNTDPTNTRPADKQYLYKSALVNQLFGLTPDTLDIGADLYFSPGERNPYTDYNCVLSSFVIYNNLFKDKNNNGIIGAQFAQAFDNKCTTYEDLTYKSRIYEGSLCFNIMDIDAIKANNSSIKITQSCGNEAIRQNVENTTSLSARDTNNYVSSTLNGVNDNPSGGPSNPSGGPSNGNNSTGDTETSIIPGISNTNLAIGAGVCCCLIIFLLLIIMLL